MKQIYHLGNLPSPVQIFVKTEALANMYAGGKLSEGADAQLKEFMPEIWEARDYDELLMIIKGETDLSHEILIDKENGRYYFTSVGSSGRIKFKGDWTIDETQVNVEQTTERNGIVCFAEVSEAEARRIMGGGAKKEDE